MALRERAHAPLHVELHVAAALLHVCYVLRGMGTVSSCSRMLTTLRTCAYMAAAWGPYIAACCCIACIAYT